MVIINNPQNKDTTTVIGIENPALIQAIPIQPKMVKKPTKFLKVINPDNLINFDVH